MSNSYTTRRFMLFRKSPTVQFSLAAVVALFATLMTLNVSAGAIADDVSPKGAAAVLARVTKDIQYLASDELKGRQPGTAEMKLAEDYIVAAYRAAGLKSIDADDADRAYFQPFDAGKSRNTQMGATDATTMTLASPSGETIALELGSQYSQLIYRKGIDLENVPLVFVGYGIDAADEHNYNEYADVDVKGKAVVLIRREPQQNDPKSVFEGKEVSSYAYLQTKVKSAMDAGAAAVLMVNDSYTLQRSEGVDELPAAEQFGRVTRLIPFLHIKREVLENVLKTTPVITFDGGSLSTVAEIENQIDNTLAPLSQLLTGWTATIKASFTNEKIMTSNIIGVIEGEGPLADETIVIGAHYDHLGMGAFGSRSADAGKAIHNGADDNATGTAAVMELARRFASAKVKPKRRLVFICFTAEEMGLLGARHYVENPLFDLKKTVAMINFDMIGYLRDDTLTVYGWRSSPAFDGVLDSANKETKLNLNKPPSGFAGSDHLPFDNKQVPNMFLHTGLNTVYHTPEDDFEAIDCAGAVRVIDFSESLIKELADGEKGPVYRRPVAVRSSAQLGVGFTVDDDTKRLVITRVIADTPAEEAGFKKGDQIVSWDGDSKINNRRRLTRQIKKDAGKLVKVKVIRGGAEVLLSVELKK